MINDSNENKISGKKPGKNLDNLESRMAELSMQNKELIAMNAEKEKLIADIESRRSLLAKLNESLTNVNTESATLVCELEAKNQSLQEVNLQLARANAHAAELMATIELQADQNKKLNKALSTANAHAAELLAEIEMSQSARDELNRQIINEKERLNITLRSIGDGVITTDVEGYIDLFNQAAENLTGWNQYEVMGKKLAEIINLQFQCGRNVSNALLPLKTKQDGKSEVYIPEAWIRARNGMLRPVELSHFLVQDNGGQILGSVNILRDRTKQKELELLKEEFIATMTHDLKTPLISIMGFVKLLFEDEFGAISPKKIEFANRIKNSSEILLGIINNIIDVTRIDAGKIKYDFEDFDLGDLFEGIKETFELLADDGKITLLMDGCKDIWVNADRQRIRQVFHNLISNALRYTPKGGKISVSVTDKGDRIAVELSDTGIGIPETEHGKLFRKFARIISERCGTGLGLYNVKNFLKGHGSDITFESSPGKGTRFFFELAKGSKPSQ